MVNLIIHRSLLRGLHRRAVLRRLRGMGQRPVTDIPQRAVPESRLMLECWLCVPCHNGASERRLLSGEWFR
jgi:hypothetical protein